MLKRIGLIVLAFSSIGIMAYYILYSMQFELENPVHYLLGMSLFAAGILFVLLASLAQAGDKHLARFKGKLKDALGLASTAYIAALLAYLLTNLR